MPEVFAITNQKGGVGKTTSTINIAASLAKHHDKKVLVFDFDQQGNLTKGLGIEIVKDHTVLEALLQVSDHTPYPYMDNYHVIPADQTFTSFETFLSHPDFLDLVDEIGKENLLKDYIQENCQEYDYILIDCPPALNIITINAMVAADKVLIPLLAHSFSVQGLDTVLKLMTRMTKRLNPDLDLGGVFFVQHSERTIIAKETAASVREVAQGKVFKTFIRKTVSLEESTLENVCLDVFTYDEEAEQESNGSIDYRNLTSEILGAEITEKVYEPRAKAPSAEEAEQGEETEELGEVYQDLSSQFSDFLKSKKK